MPRRRSRSRRRSTRTARRSAWAACSATPRGSRCRRRCSRPRPARPTSSTASGAGPPTGSATTWPRPAIAGRSLAPGNSDVQRVASTRIGGPSGPRSVPAGSRGAARVARARAGRRVARACSSSSSARSPSRGSARRRWRRSRRRPRPRRAGRWPRRRARVRATRRGAWSRPIRSAASERTVGVPARDGVELRARHRLADDPAEEQQPLQLLVIQRPGAAASRLPRPRAIRSPRAAGRQRANRRAGPVARCAPPPGPSATEAGVQRPPVHGERRVTRSACRPCAARRPREDCHALGRDHRAGLAREAVGKLGDGLRGRRLLGEAPDGSVALDEPVQSPPARVSAVRSLARRRRRVPSTTRNMAIAAAPAMRSRVTSSIAVGSTVPSGATAAGTTNRDRGDEQRGARSRAEARRSARSRRRPRTGGRTSPAALPAGRGSARPTITSAMTATASSTDRSPRNTRSGVAPVWRHERGRSLHAHYRVRLMGLADAVRRATRPPTAATPGRRRPTTGRPVADRAAHAGPPPAARR